MENGFLCILKNAASEDASTMESFRSRFAEMRTYDKGGARIVWFGDSPPLPYFMGSSIFVGGDREYPTSEIFLDPTGMTVTVRTDALGFQSPCIGRFEGTLFVSNSATTIAEAARHFSIPLRLDGEAIRTEVSYKITPIGKTIVSGISEAEGGTDAVYGFSENGPEPLRKNRVRRINFSKTDSVEEDCHGAYLREFENSIERIVESTEGEKIGVLFSGGFDSSVTLNALLRHGKHRRGGIVPITVT
ncbi:MAG: hypothetical protein QG650_131 [Patescibacteria group bacterium]|nr:hypothetical protein [Patescibacteria group bacterium]